MDFMVDIDIKKPAEQISYRDKILLIGSCFTEHIGNALEELKFSVLQNPNGILFDPESVCKSVVSYISNKKYSEDDLFQLNEVWHSWQHHSRFSNIDKREGLRLINQSQQEAHEFLKETDWIVITLGSSFSYRLAHNHFKNFLETAPPTGGGINVRCQPPKKLATGLSIVDSQEHVSAEVRRRPRSEYGRLDLGQVERRCV